VHDPDAREQISFAQEDRLPSNPAVNWGKNEKRELQKEEGRKKSILMRRKGGTISGFLNGKDHKQKQEQHES